MAAPEAQLDEFIDKFSVEVATLARSILTKMRKRLPGAIELVYDNYNALAIGFAKGERTSDAPFSIAGSMKSCPSAVVPFTATKTKPGFTSDELFVRPVTATALFVPTALSAIVPVLRPPPGGLTWTSSPGTKPDAPSVPVAESG